MAPLGGRAAQRKDCRSEDIWRSALRGRRFVPKEAAFNLLSHLHQVVLVHVLGLAAAARPQVGIRLVDVHQEGGKLSGAAAVGAVDGHGDDRGELAVAADEVCD